jgi:1-acyl-sn-glycerol-3-phosphate acyltransferase
MGRQPREVYRFRVSYVLRFLVAMFLNQRRNLANDISATLLAARPQPRILDDHYIPSEGPFILAANHYERPGLKVFWGGMLASYAVAQRRTKDKAVRWLMTSEWYNYRIGPLPVPVWLLRWLFRRIAYVYDLVVVPRSVERAVGRAAAMRSILQVLDRQREPIGLFPEGVGGGTLIEPQPGTGAFLLSLSQRGISILPAGVFEEEGALTVRFGPASKIDIPTQAEKGDRDRLAREQVMVNIGRLLPRSLWGAYSLRIEEALARSQRMA